LRYSKTVSIIVLIIFVAAVLSFVGGCANSPAPKLLPGQPAAMEKPPRMVIGYYENPYPGTPDKTGSFPSMKAFSKSMSAVGPFWYSVTKDGTLQSKESQLVYDTAKGLGLKMFPLITNKQEATDAILGDPAVRSKTVDNIVKVVKERNYDGVNIDFELVPKKHRDNLSAFMAELYPKMSAMRKTVIISVFPQVEVTEDISGAYDYQTLAKSADFLQLMLYDHHWETSPPGPLASIDWYEKNLKYAIDKVGAAKVIAGLGAYGYDWPKQGGSAETVKYVDAIVLAVHKGAEIKYDDAAQAPHFSYDDHEVWFENAKSTAAKLDILAKYDPAGVAIWRLGQEQPEIWPLIDQKFPKQQ